MVVYAPFRLQSARTGKLFHVPATSDNSQEAAANFPNTGMRTAANGYKRKTNCEPKVAGIAAVFVVTRTGEYSIFAFATGWQNSGNQHRKRNSVMAVLSICMDRVASD